MSETASTVASAQIVGQVGTHQAMMSGMAVADLVMDRLGVTGAL